MSTDSEMKLQGNRAVGERIVLLYRQLPAAIVPPVFAALLVAYLMREQVPATRLLFWVAWVSASYFTLPGLLYLWYRRAGGIARQPASWGRRYVLMALLTATSWGAAGTLLYVPDEPLYQMFLAGMLFTSAASVMVTTFAYTQGYYAAVVPILLPLTVRFLMEDQPIHYAMAGLILLVFCMLGFFQRNMVRGLKESIALRYDREALVGELEEKNRQIATAVRNKSECLAAASHDLRQPLHAQRLFVAELDARIKDPDTRQILSHIKQSMKSMDLLLDEVTDISQLDSGAIEVQRTVFPLLTILERIEQQFRLVAIEKGLGFRVARCAATVHCDPDLLERILRNLVQNAVRYTDTGAVMIVCRHRGHCIEIQVRDSGPGIPADKQQTIFAEFVRLGNTSPQSGKGLGLGLAIVSRLAHLLELETGLRSRPGEGSTFFVRVPVAATRDRLSSRHQPASSIERALEGLRILLVDDDPAILRGMQLLLDRWGCNSRLAGDAAEALQFIGQGSRPQVVIADYNLPGDINGLELIARVRGAAEPSLPAILITSDTRPALLVDARAHGVILMPKPVEPENLRNLLFNFGRAQTAAGQPQSLARVIS